MAKRVKAVVKLQIAAGKANPAPPVGPALGQHGVNIMGFVKEYNERTASQVGSIVPVEITIYEDRSFTFKTKTPPAVDLIKKAAGIQSAAKNSRTEKAGRITHEQVRSIAEQKMADLNAINIEGAMKMIEGTARSMGVEVGA